MNYADKILEGYNFAKQKLSGTGIDLTKDEHNQLKESYHSFNSRLSNALSEGRIAANSIS